MRDIGFSTNETVTVTITDGSPERGSGTRSATSPTTDREPQPEISVSRGGRCNDSSGSTPCYRGGGGTRCVHPSCGFIVFSTRNFTSGSVTCKLFDSADGYFATRTVSTNRSEQTMSYFGYPDRSIWADCNNGPTSPRYNWPNS